MNFFTEGIFFNRIKFFGREYKYLFQIIFLKKKRFLENHIFFLKIYIFFLKIYIFFNLILLHLNNHKSRVEDHMAASEETPEKVQITRDMLHYVKEASRKYKKDLFQQRQEKQNERKSLKQKIVYDEIKQIKAKYCILPGEIEDVTISADKLALEAENYKNFAYFTELNEKKTICKV